ncbi:MAG: DUF1583 domain-containing protein [Fuerstiella sp.]
MIKGSHRPEFSGTHHENLLYYNRPLIEDGSITYRFFYRKGEYEVHPVLGTSAFLLSPEGVSLHRITDGRFDTSDRDPGYRHDVSLTAEAIPLKNDGWNELRLSVIGDTAEFILNGRKVFTHTISKEEPRTFGLFHYSDRTEARVHSVTWTGDWPETISQVELQELTSPTSLFPELNLNDSLHLNFSETESPVSRGGFSNSNASSELTPHGLRVQHQSGQGFSHCFVAPNLQVRGDFDVVVSFDGLAAIPDEGGACGIALEAVLSDPALTHASVYRGHVRRSGQKALQTAHLYIHRQKGEDARQLWLGNIVEACDSGRLRLIRSGDTLYALIAEEDSSHFRLVSTEKVPTASPILNGLRVKLLTQAGSTSVLLKSMDIRADHLSGPATEDTAEKLTLLNHQRDGLAQHFTRDFTQAAPASTDFSPVGSAEEWEWTAADGGLRIVADGSEAWLTDGFALNRAIVGDFDIATQFDVQQLPTPTARLSSVYLQLQFRDTSRSRPTLIFHKDEAGNTTIVAENWLRRPGGGTEYQTVSKVAVESVSGLRFVRRADELFYVVTSTQFARDRVIAKVEVPAGPIFSGDVTFRVHAGGTGLQATVQSKGIDVHADQVRKILTPEQRAEFAAEPLE